MEGAMGKPIEVMLEGPGRHRHQPDRAAWRPGRARAHWPGSATTAVSNAAARRRWRLTTSHHVKEYDLGARGSMPRTRMSIHNDLVLGGENMERFTRYQRTRARDTHLPGQPRLRQDRADVSAELRLRGCDPEAVAPNIGYLAQTFLVDDLAATLALAAQVVGATTFNPPVEMELAPLGRVTAAIVRNPGSGALQVS